MSHLTDLKQEQQQTVAMETGQSQSEGEEHHPCHFFRGRRGGRRGRCHRRHQMGFFHQFATRFLLFSAISLAYTHRSAINHAFQPAIDFASSWLAGPYSILKALADVPYQIHPFIGLLFYSALAAFVLTSMKMRLIQKRRARMQKWRSESGSRHGHGHRHGRHAHVDSAASEQSIDSQVEVEKEPLIVVD